MKQVFQPAAFSLIWSDQTGDKELIKHKWFNTKKYETIQFHFLFLDNTFAHHFIDFTQRTG